MMPRCWKCSVVQAARLHGVAAILFLTASVRGGLPPRAPCTGTDTVGVLAVADGGTIPYRPRPGDIVLYDSFNRFHHFVYKMAGTGPPTHVALVIEGDDGKPVLLELAGPTVIRAQVVIMDVAERLRSYPGSILIRRSKRPLTTDECAAMRQFAHAQEGKYFASRRIVLQVTPFRARTGLRHYCFGRTYFNRQRWICSEMVVAALSSAGVLDPVIYTANATYPRDLAYDEHYDFSPIYEPAAPWLPGNSSP